MFQYFDMLKILCVRLTQECQTHAEDFHNGKAAEFYPTLINIFSIHTVSAYCNLEDGAIIALMDRYKIYTCRE